MRTLLLLRHGKSDWEAGARNDQDRPLNKRGKKAARRVGRYLAAVGSVPDLVLTSTAVRAVSTVALAAEAGNWNCEVVQTGRLYEAAPEDLVPLIREQADSIGVLLLAGHEPTFSSLASLLIGGGSVKLPTAAVACIEFAAEHWAEVRPGTGQLAWLIVPKQLDDTETAA
jgi:phosphohistidine phosphatase